MKQLRSIKNGKHIFLDGKNWQVNCKWKNNLGQFAMLIRVKKRYEKGVEYESRIEPTTIKVMELPF